MTKLFCDLCEREIPGGERRYNVILRVMLDPHDDADEVTQEYADFCYECTKSGRALTELMAWYESDLPAEAQTPAVEAAGSPVTKGV